MPTPPRRSPTQYSDAHPPFTAGRIRKVDRLSLFPRSPTGEGRSQPAPHHQGGETWDEESPHYSRCSRCSRCSRSPSVRVRRRPGGHAGRRIAPGRARLPGAGHHHRRHRFHRPGRDRRRSLPPGPGRTTARSDRAEPLQVPEGMTAAEVEAAFAEARRPRFHRRSSTNSPSTAAPPPSPAPPARSSSTWPPASGSSISSAPARKRTRTEGIDLYKTVTVTGEPPAVADPEAAAEVGLIDFDFEIAGHRRRPAPRSGRSRAPARSRTTWSSPRSRTAPPSSRSSS